VSRGRYQRRPAINPKDPAAPVTQILRDHHGKHIGIITQGGLSTSSSVGIGLLSVLLATLNAMPSELPPQRRAQ
jgi:hypothetical protein